jgi:phospholipid/cholesterol/gamma-HCH transport system substrate-binding protein
MHNETVETLIGAVVIAIAVVFTVFAYRSTGTTPGGSGYQLTAKMNRVDGLAVGTDVRLAGLKVGTIAAMTLGQDYLITVHMAINTDVKVPDDSSLVVTSSSLLGSSYLSISPGGSDKMLPPGGVIKNTQGAIDMMGLLNRFVNSSSGSSSSATPAPAPAQP